MIEQSVVDALIANPSESLNVELKRWIDPTQLAGIEKIAKGALALYNRNGGYLAIGFDNKTRQPDLPNEPSKVQSLFNIDTVQGIISKYAFEPFEIEVAWGKRDGRGYPVIVVPSGVRTPVATKRDLLDGQRVLIREGAIYFRTLASNGTPSTAEARAADWREILDICNDNREVDIAKFLRRHLPGFNTTSLLTPVPTLRERALKVLDYGEARCAEELKNRELSADEKKLLDRGSWSVALVIDPPHLDALPDQHFSAVIGAANPNYTGWPIWLDARFNSNREHQPRVIRNALEYLIVTVSSDFSNKVEFARLDPKGDFFLHRLLIDDAVPSQVTPGTTLDPILAIIRVAEALGVGIAFARSMGWTPEETKLGFACQWTGLAGRSLTSWSRPFETIEGGIAYDNQISSFVEFSLDTPLSALGQFVDQATKELFIAFGGKTIPRQTIDHWVERLFRRQLSGS
jgi:hypothetical protein